MKDPNFFIIGAPKCGTTALSEYLREHPNVFVTFPKEPHYFAFDFPTKQGVKTREDYDRLYADTTDQHIAVGEASIFYLFSEAAVRAIDKQYPKSKFIVMLRDPVEFLLSWHNQVVKRFQEDRAFEEGWVLRDRRRRDAHVPTHCTDPRFLDYEAMASFGRQVDRLFRTVPKERVMLIRFEDFRVDTQLVYESVLQFLDVPTDQREHFPVINKRNKHRVPILGYAMQKGYPVLKKVGPARRNNPLRVVARSLLTSIKGWNEVLAPAPVASPELEREIRQCLHADLQLLSRLSGWDLKDWIEGKTQETDHA